MHKIFVIAKTNMCKYKSLQIYIIFAKFAAHDKKNRHTVLKDVEVIDTLKYSDFHCKMEQKLKNYTKPQINCLCKL